MKKTFAVLTAGVLLTASLFSGCSGSTTASSSAAATTAAATTAAATEAAATAAPETTAAETEAETTEAETTQAAAAGKTEYTFEFEDLDFTGMVGDGNSGSAQEWEMVGSAPAFGIKIPEGQEPSNGHYVYFNYTAGLSFDFEITSDKDTTADMVVRLGSEIGNIVDLGPDAGLTILVNGEALAYDPFTVEALAINGGPVPYTFEDYAISAPVELKEGTNTISFVITQRKTLSAPNDAPTMDCFTLSVDEGVTLTFTNNYQEENGNPGYSL